MLDLDPFVVFYMPTKKRPYLRPHWRRWRYQCRSCFTLAENHYITGLVECLYFFYHFFFLLFSSLLFFSSSLFFFLFFPSFFSPFFLSSFSLVFFSLIHQRTLRGTHCSFLFVLWWSSFVCVWFLRDAREPLPPLISHHHLSFKLQQFLK